MSQAPSGHSPREKQPPPRLPYVIGLMAGLFVFGVSVGYFQERAFWWVPFYAATQPATGKAARAGDLQVELSCALRVCEANRSSHLQVRGLGVNGQWLQDNLSSVRAHRC